MLRQYYEEEMRYLHEAGRAFAEAFPEQAGLLNVDSVTDRDPYVERLFEGFAFLTGRIREQLDDELPQYTRTLGSLLFPHFLRPIPSLALVAFAPKPGKVQRTTVLPRGTEVRSGAVAGGGPCRFVTTRAVRLQPLRLESVASGWTPEGGGRLTFRFELAAGASVRDLELAPLRLHLVADATTSSLLHLHLTRHVTRVVVGTDLDGTAAFGAEPVELRGQEWVRPGGLDDDEALLPASERAFSGFRLLQEYLAFRRKFWCVDLLGLDRFAPSVPVGGFEVRVDFDRPLPERHPVRTDHFRLFCSPVVNLFEHDAEPIRVDHRVPEYRVPVNANDHLEVYDVLRGVGVEEATGRRHAYRPFVHFEHVREAEAALHDDGELRYFTHRTGFSPAGRYAAWVAPAPDGGGALEPETLSLDLLCTNGALPRETLQEHDLNRLAPGVPDVAAPDNLTKPTLVRYPPTDDRRFYWRLISHWALNHGTVASREAVQGLLELYDWSEGTANRRRIGGVRDVAWRRKEVLRRGAIVRGAEVTLKVQEDHFADEGDAVLFGLVMSRFLGAYATINSFVHLKLELLLSGRSYTWQPKRGTRLLV